MIVVRTILFAVLFTGASAMAQVQFEQPCPDRTLPDRSVVICTPTQGSLVPASYIIVGHVTDSLSFTSDVIIDGLDTGAQPGQSDIFVETASSIPGPHLITLKATDSSGTISTSVLLFEITTNATPCAPSSTNQTVTICTPHDGDQESSPVTLAAVTTDSNPVVATQVYVDGVKAAEGNSDAAGGSPKYVLAHVLMQPGTHRVTYQALEQSGTVIKKTIHITVR
jgi:hypothetical protein